ncbi:MAG TPA: hypothetical protein VHN77_02805 [Phycisphaerales bacterium]|nr:hypothetical protein [Phycisphaerales bacterium]
MKALFAVAAFAAVAGSAQAGILGPGAIAFTGFNADGTDNLAFVAIQPLPVGTVIGFTDNEWNGTAWVDSNENGFELTITTAVPAGAIVRMDTVGGASITDATSNYGTIAGIAGAGTNLGVSNSNEAIYAFIGSYASPVSFLALVANDIEANSGSIAGTGLVAGVTAQFNVLNTADEDIFAYVGARSGAASFADYLPLINGGLSSEWISQDASGDQSIDGIGPDVPFDGTAFTIVPTPGAIALLGLGGLVAIRRRR